jgi:hypothetical protein
VVLVLAGVEDLAGRRGRGLGLGGSRPAGSAGTAPQAGLAPPRCAGAAGGGCGGEPGDAPPAAARRRLPDGTGDQHEPRHGGGHQRVLALDGADAPLDHAGQAAVGEVGHERGHVAAELAFGVADLRRGRWRWGRGRWHGASLLAGMIGQGSDTEPSSPRPYSASSASISRSIASCSSRVMWASTRSGRPGRTGGRGARRPATPPCVPGRPGLGARPHRPPDHVQPLGFQGEQLGGALQRQRPQGAGDDLGGHLPGDAEPLADLAVGEPFGAQVDGVGLTPADRRRALQQRGGNPCRATRVGVAPWVGLAGHGDLLSGGGLHDRSGARRASTAARNSAAASRSAAAGVRSPSAAGQAWCSHTRPAWPRTVHPATVVAGWAGPAVTVGPSGVASRCRGSGGGPGRRRRCGRRGG